MTVFLLIEAREIECSVIDDIRHRGLSPILFTSRYLDESHFYHGIDMQLFDEVYCVDTFDSVAMLDCIKHNGIPVTAVLGSYDEVMVPAVDVAQALGLPCPCLDGLRCAFNHERARTPDAHRACICQNAAHYRHAITGICQGQRATLSNAHRHVIMEQCTMVQCIEGPYYGAELLYHNGHWRVIAVNRRFLSAGDRAYVTGICQPSDLDPERLAQASIQVQRWVEALKLRGGALSVTFIYTADGPVLVDMTLGIANARVNKQVELTTGINMMVHVVDFVCGKTRALSRSLHPRYPFVADAFIFCPRAGQHDASLIDKNHRYFIASCLKPSSGQSILARRAVGKVIVGDVMAYGESCQQAMEHAQTLVRQVGVKPWP
ncbi:hypothetical protein SJI19_01455 [Acerihabitans sp. TG2]|uniref:hypothetical protein n=1 Tax=Acerihabitans sp. TG2 TaxID=3096008 RepID=UPI002B235048|nr:hypothetical protein [Acerihabitans sp. TG2]MEA9389228.1 hypothetical protein [Acerihabitans sp. TG2]